MATPKPSVTNSPVLSESSGSSASASVSFFFFRFTAMSPISGGYSAGVPPLPIPNRAVKPGRADGTAQQWESR